MRNNDGSDEVRFTRRTALRGTAAGGLVLGSGALLAACGGSDSRDNASTSEGAPVSKVKRGGTFKVGRLTGGSSETVDAQVYYAGIDGLRLYQLYDKLVYWSDSPTGLDYVLAESIEPNPTADVWTIRLKDGIEFHNGKTLAAEDVEETMKRVKESTAGGNTIFKELVDMNSFKKLDKLTLRFSLKSPHVYVPEAFSDYTSGIVPVGYDPKKPVGCGPFKYKSFTAGKQSVFTRFENYWQEGKPYLDEVEIISFEDETSMVNALVSGQIDAAEKLSQSATAQVQANSNLTTIKTAIANSWVPIVMNIQMKPFDDVRVRQAFRLLVDREQMIEQVFRGNGVVGNDWVLSMEADGDPGLPQREVDVEQAKSLLKAAGQEGLSAELVTAAFVPEAVPTAEVFSQQAKAAGLNIKVRKVDTGTFYGDEILQRPLTSDYWSLQPYAMQADTMLIPAPGKPWNETGFDDPEYRQIMKQAITTVDREKRLELLHECMRIEHERGGYIQWGAQYSFDGASKKVQGLGTDAIGDPLGSHNFREVYLS
jgi:peptide/nickel transport system substrate-binding protein